MSSAIGLSGMLLLLVLAWCFSSDRKAIRLRTVAGALALQVAIGGFVLYFPWGKQALAHISAGVNNAIHYGKDGVAFLFGPLVSPQMSALFSGKGFVFALNVLPLVIFFSALISVLYYLGIMQWVIRLLGGTIQKLLGTSKTESMSATSNIFVGQSEAPLVIKPFLARMTDSESFAVMVGGMASISGTTLAGYAALGVKMDYLVAASFMAAPGGLLFAKLLMPENGFRSPGYMPDENAPPARQPVNILEAAAEGAASGLKLAVNIGAMLLAFIGLIAMLNGLLGGIGDLFGLTLSMERILGWAFSPLAFLLGVPWQDSAVAGNLIGQKLILNEFVAYVNFSPWLQDTQSIIAQGLTPLSDKTTAIISFALCGFANLSSIAILMGGLSVLAPERRAFIARTGVKAMAAGTASNLMSATIAGIFLSL